MVLQKITGEITDKNVLSKFRTSCGLNEPKEWSDKK